MTTLTTDSKSDTHSADLSKIKYQWRNPKVLRSLYLGDKLSQSQIGERLGCEPSTVSKWLNKFDIETRRRGPGRKAGASYAVNKDGRPYWSTGDPDGSTSGVFVHQLTKVADGADPRDVFAKGNGVHHKNKIPFDNRPDNLKLMSNDKHNRAHSTEKWVYDPELGHRVLKSTDGDGDEGDEE